MEAMSFHGDWLFRGSVSLCRLPQLNPVPLGVCHPCETAVLDVLDLRVDLRPFATQRGEHGIEILHPVVDHEGRAVLSEVRRLGGEQGPDRVALLSSIPPAPPLVPGHRALDVDPESVAIPASERLRVLRPEEDATDPRHAGTSGRAAMAVSRPPSISPFRKAFPRHGFREAPP